MSQPSAGKASLERVRKLVDSKQYDEALAMCDELMRAGPVDYEFYNERVYVFSGLGRRDDALKDLQSLMSLRPDAPNAYFQRALWALADGEFAAASADFERVVETGEPYFLEDACFYMAVTLLNSGEKGNALRYVQRLSPDYSHYARTPGKIRGMLSRQDLLALASAV
jgi:tetratricopeptide (TPR) repeat protein